VVGGLTMVVTLLAPSSGRPALVAFLPVGLLLRDTDLEGAHRFADRLRETVARETAIGEVALTVGIGLAQAEPWTTADDLLRGADVALYSAKAAGRNRVTVHTGELTPA
jgi:diguanylate cyclase (GGDEF)-like protein